MKNCSSTPLFLLGTIAGLVIVMAISWTCATELLWQYFQPPKKEERWYWQYFGVVFGGILYSIECFFNTLSYIFFVPVSRRFRKEVTEKTLDRFREILPPLLSRTRGNRILWIFLNSCNTPFMYIAYTIKNCRFMCDTLLSE